MLWDPKKDTKPAVDPFSVAGLVAWLETQPADGEYCYEDGGRCLIAKYIIAIGYRRPNIGGYSMSADGLPSRKMPFGWEDISCIEPHTFGAALQRARSYL